MTIIEIIEGALRGHHQSLRAQLDRIEHKIDRLLHPPSLAAVLAFELPTLTRNGTAMTTFSLPNDQILTITIKATDLAGAFEPIPVGDTFTVTVSDPASLNAVMGTDAAGNVALVVNALVPTATGVIVTVSDSSGLKAAEQVFDIVTDTAPVALALDMVDATHTSQPVPATP